MTDWLHNEGLGRREVPVDRVLDLWARGLTASQIAEAIGPVRGAKFGDSAIRKAVKRARQAGDPRAVKR